MITREPKDVCAAVVSHLPFDARVWKQARSLSRDGYEVVLLGCRYELPKAHRFSEGRIDVLEVPFGERRGKPQRGARIVAVLRLWLEILRTRAHAYHAHNIHVAPPAWLAARLRRSSLVYDAHELYGEVEGDAGFAGRLLARAEQAIERFMVRHSDGVVTTNPSRVEVLRERHGREAIETLANVPELTGHVEPLDPGFPRGAPTLLYQGGVYARSRAFRETLHALGLLEGVHFVVIGFGRDSDLDLVRRWADEAGVQERVRLLPPRPFTELVRTAAAATVGLVPVKADTTSNMLGDTNKLYEYLMAGLPVAASDLPEVRRVVGAGSPPVGELFDPSSPESIANAVRRVLDDDELYQLRREEARRLAVESFNWQMEERKLLAIYGMMVGASANGRMLGGRP